VAALVDTPQNTRAFEALDGLLMATSLFKSRQTSRDVKLKLCEFIYFYLMPETPRRPADTAPPGLLARSPSKLSRAFAAGSEAGPRRKAAAATEASEVTRSTEEKQAMLACHLSNVDGMLPKFYFLHLLSRSASSEFRGGTARGR
jgi:hypothetical protein